VIETVNMTIHYAWRSISMFSSLDDMELINQPLDLPLNIYCHSLFISRRVEFATIGPKRGLICARYAHSQNSQQHMPVRISIVWIILRSSRLGTKKGRTAPMTAHIPDTIMNATKPKAIFWA